MTSSLPAGGGGEASAVVGGQDPVLRRLRVTWGCWYKVTVSFLLPPLQPSPRIMDYQMAFARGR